MLTTTAPPVAPLAFEVREPCALLSPLVEPNAKTRMLYCFGCSQVTTQKMIREDGQKYYECPCGERLIYFAVAKVEK
jgi:hypothetical protein